MSVKLYARWVHCIKDQCPESRDGKCNKEHETEFPEDGKCLFPMFDEYQWEWEEAGVYEMEDEK